MEVGIFNFFRHKHIDEPYQDQAKEMQFWIDKFLKQHPEILRIELASEGCDIVNGSAGEFGRNAKNPIPVNAPTGELQYLNMLTPHSLFHRLGSIFSSYFRRHLDI